MAIAVTRRVDVPVTLDLFPPSGTTSGWQAASVERPGAGNGNAFGIQAEGAHCGEIQARARRNRRLAIVEFFAARLGQRISSAELHQTY